MYTDAVAKLHKTARNLMVLKGIPWFIQATLSDEGFVSMEDLATRGLARPCKENGAGGVGLRPQQPPLHGCDLPADRGPHVPGGSRGSTIHGSWGACKQRDPGHTRPGTPPRISRSRAKQLTKPKLALQGSDQLVKRQFKLCAGGEIGFIPMKYLVSALPEPGERPWKTTKKSTVDGWDREDEVEERGEPKTRHQLLLESWYEWVLW